MVRADTRAGTDKRASILLHGALLGLVRGALCFQAGGLLGSGDLGGDGCDCAVSLNQTC